MTHKSVARSDKPRWQRGKKGSWPRPQRARCVTVTRGKGDTPRARRPKPRPKPKTLRRVAPYQQLVGRSLGALPIVLYRWFVSPLFPSACNYCPTCSEYTRAAIMRFGVVKGVLAGVLRLGRCRARYWGGDDPLPAEFEFSALMAEYAARDRA